jgi:hypothetical protein
MQSWPQYYQVNGQFDSSIVFSHKDSPKLAGNGAGVASGRNEEIRHPLWEWNSVRPANNQSLNWFGS